MSGDAMKKILVPVDFNPLATSALVYAVQYAQRSGATLIVMYADTFEPPAEFTAEQTAGLVASLAESRRRTAEELERYAHEHVPETIALQTEVREGLPLAAILAAIDAHGPDLVVMGTHGRGGLSRLMYGSVTEAVLGATNTPVLTIRSVEPPRVPKDIVCVQSASSDASQRAASQVADLFGAHCRTIAVTSDEAAQATADLIVVDEDIHAITRHARAPVLHVVEPERRG